MGRNRNACTELHFQLLSFLARHQIRHADLGNVVPIVAQMAFDGDPFSGLHLSIAPEKRLAPRKLTDTVLAPIDSSPRSNSKFAHR
jgi:hypothetical protein